MKIKYICSFFLFLSNLLCLNIMCMRQNNTQQNNQKIFLTTGSPETLDFFSSKFFEKENIIEEVFDITNFNKTVFLPGVLEPAPVKKICTTVKEKGISCLVIRTKIKNIATNSSSLYDCLNKLYGWLSYSLYKIIKESQDDLNGGIIGNITIIVTFESENACPSIAKDKILEQYVHLTDKPDTSKINKLNPYTYEKINLSEINTENENGFSELCFNTGNIKKDLVSLLTLAKKIDNKTYYKKLYNYIITLNDLIKPKKCTREIEKLPVETIGLIVEFINPKSCFAERVYYTNQQEDDSYRCNIM